MAQALVDFSADRQAMGVGNQAHPRFPVLLDRPRARLLLPFVYPN
jgi:hypothetical protein